MTATQPIILSNAFQARSARAGLLVLTMLVTGVLLLAWVILRRPSPVPGPAVATTRESLAPTQNQTPTISATVTANGFSLAEATCSPGKVLLVISNQSGGGNLVLKLSRANGQPVAEFGVASATGELRQEVSLDAGTYTLKETNHASWVFRITAQ